MEQFYLICTYVLCGVLGLCVGSFLNVVIYRVPLGMSLSKPDSHCPVCKNPIRFYDNIPLLSYLILGGRCRHCKTRISVRYPAVELVHAALWLLCVFLFWEQSVPLACICMLTLSVFLCIFFIDLEHQIIPDRFQVILLCLGVASCFADRAFAWYSHLIGGAVGFLLFYLVAWGFYRLCGKEGLGGGDVKLCGAVGLLLGWERLLLGLLIATVPAAIVMSLFKKDGEGESRPFPFGPFLVVGFAVALLFGAQIVNWYLPLFGL